MNLFYCQLIWFGAIFLEFSGGFLEVILRKFAGNWEKCCKIWWFSLRGDFTWILIFLGVLVSGRFGFGAFWLFHFFGKYFELFGKFVIYFDVFCKFDVFLKNSMFFKFMISMFFYVFFLNSKTFLFFYILHFSMFFWTFWITGVFLCFFTDFRIFL